MDVVTIIEISMIYTEAEKGNPDTSPTPSPTASPTPSPIAPSPTTFQSGPILVFEIKTDKRSNYHDHLIDYIS